MNNWNGYFFFFSKSSILDIQVHCEYTSGNVNYFCEKHHLKYLIGSEYASAWVWQFWINEISKICHEETQKNGNKHVLFVLRNSCLKIFINFPFWMVNYQVGGLQNESNLYEHLYNLWLHTKISTTDWEQLQFLSQVEKVMVFYTHVV